MKFAVVVLFVEAMPTGALIGTAFDPAFAGSPRARRSRFWLRFAGVFIAMWLPLLVGFLAELGEEFALPLLFLQLLWGFLLVALSRFVLFGGPGFDPGSGEGGDDGPRSMDGPPRPPAPIGGIPHPYAEHSSMRLRDHRPPWRGVRPRRPTRERQRILSRAIGDQVMARRNDRSVDVDNGMRGTITALDGRNVTTIRLETGASRPARPRVSGSRMGTAGLEPATSRV